MKTRSLKKNVFQHPSGLIHAIGFSCLLCFETQAQAHILYAELEKVDVSTQINRSAEFSTDTTAALTLGAELFPNLAIELTLLGDNEYSSAGTDLSGAWETTLITSGPLLGIRGIFPLNNYVSLFARTGIQSMDVTLDIKETSTNWNSYYHSKVEDHTERLYLGGGVQLYIADTAYLMAEYLQFSETDDLFLESTAHFTLAADYVGLGIGLDF